MKLWFDEGGMTGDFNAVCDPPKDWKEACPSWEDDELEIWFRAYTTKHRTTQHEIELHSRGVVYECFIEVSTRSCFNDIELAHFVTKDREEAERLLQLAADAIYGEEW